MTTTKSIWVRHIGLLTALIGLLFAMMASPRISYAAQQYRVSAASVQNQTTQVGTAFAENMMVLVCPVVSSPCAGAAGVGVTFTAPSSGASGTFATTRTNSVTVLTDSRGIATAPAFTANSSTGSYSVSVAAAEPNPADAVPNFFFFTNSATPAVQATLISTGSGSNQSAQINAAFAIRLSVAVFDGSNRPLPGVTVTFSAPNSGASGSFADSGRATTTAVTGNTGLATAAPFQANSVDGSYVVMATVSGSQTLSGAPLTTSFALRNTRTNVNSVPSLVSISAGNAQQVKPLFPFPTNLQVAVFDGAQNHVAGATVVFTAPSSGASGTFAGGSRTYTTITGQTGLATAPTFTANALSGSYSIGVTATKDGVTASSAIGLTNGPPTLPEVTWDPASQSVVAGTTARFFAVATGVPTPTVRWQVSTNNGASFTDIPGATATTYSFVTARADNQRQYRAVFTNPAGDDTSAAATLTVLMPPSFTSAKAATFTVGVPGSFTVTADGMGRPALSLTIGALPSGLRFDAASGLISGTPTADTVGVYQLGFIAANGVKPDAVQDFTLKIVETPRITSAATATFTTGSSNQFAITASGYPAPEISIRGTLPAGISLNSLGVLQGVPQQSGSFPLTITAWNGVEPNATQQFTLTVLKVEQQPLTLTVMPKDEYLTGDKLPLFTSGGTGSGAVTFDVGTSTACEFDANLRRLVITAGEGSCELTATKAGDATYNSVTSAPVTVRVSKPTTVLEVASAVGTYGDSVRLSATLTSRGLALPGKVISFTINGEVVGSATTDANGVAALAEVRLDSVRAGIDPAGIEARFAGDRGYAGSAATGSLGIN